MNLLIFLGAFLLSLLVTFILEKRFIPKLMQIKMGQKILDIGPRWHKSKEGTPIMGGLFFIGGIFIAMCVFALPYIIEHRELTVVKIFIMMLLNGAVGFIDDFVKFVKKQNKGLSAIQKLVLQFLIAACFLMSMAQNLTTDIKLPFIDQRIELGIFYWFFSIIFIVFMVNSVNITDGIDGLATSVTFIIFIFFSALSYRIGANLETRLALFGAVCGGLIGFFIYNYHPAKIFMGDTGSLFLGGAVVGAAYWINNPLIIAVCGLIFIIEAVSVIIQVSCYKLTKKRVFKMAPLHHHFEMCGWKETKIVRVFSLLTALFCIIAYLGL